MIGWIEEGFFIRLATPQFNEKQFYFIDQTEKANYLYTWTSSITKDTESGPLNVEDLKPLATNRLYQCIFGIKGACYIYLNSPLNVRLWGTDKKPIASSSLREVGYRTQEDSPFDAPSFVTEFFLQKDGSFDFPAVTSYNPTERALTPKLKFLINKMVIEKVTEEETLMKLKKKLIPYRPITLGGVPPVREGRATS